MIKVGLTKYGFDVETFEDARAALQNFKEGTYSIQLEHTVVAE